MDALRMACGSIIGWGIQLLAVRLPVLDVPAWSLFVSVFLILFGMDILSMVLHIEVRGNLWADYRERHFSPRVRISKDRQHDER